VQHLDKVQHPLNQWHRQILKLMVLWAVALGHVSNNIYNDSDTTRARLTVLLAHKRTALYRRG